MPRHHVLVVEDNKWIRDLTLIELRRAGYVVQPACDGQEAWELLSSGREFDLILSDNSMPRMSGLELLQRVRTDPRTADTPFILMSGAGRVSVADSTPLKTVCEDLNAVFILKPWDREHKRIVEALIRARKATTTQS